MMISNYTMCASVHVRSAEPEEDHLQTPNCSNTGYEDEEDHHGDDHPGDEAEVVLQNDPSVPQLVVCTIMEKAPTRAFSWLKVPTSAFTFKTLLRHYVELALTPR